MPSSRCETLVLPFVPVVPNSSGSVVAGAGAVDPRREVAEQRRADRRRRARADPQRCGDVGAGGIGDDRDGALVGGGGGELGAVAIDALDGDEGLAGAQIGGGEGDARQR